MKIPEHYSAADKAQPGEKRVAKEEDNENMGDVTVSVVSGSEQLPTPPPTATTTMEGDTTHRELLGKERNGDVRARTYVRWVHDGSS